MKKLINALNNISKDKWMHFTITLLIALFVFAIGSICGLGIFASIPALVLSMGAGVGKEIYDAKHGGVFDHYDIVADFFGVFIAAVLIALL